MLPQRQIFPFRDRDVCYSNLFQAPQCCHTGRVPLSGSETYVIQILSRHNYAATKKEIPLQGYRRFLFESFQGATMLPQRQNSPFSDRYFCWSNLFQAPLCHHKGRVSLLGIETFFIRIYSNRHYAVTQAEFPFQGVRRLLFKSFPGTTMLPQIQNSPLRDKDVCYSNLFKAPLCCHNGRIPLSGIYMFVIRIFCRRHCATTKAEFPFQGVWSLLFKSFPGTTMLLQRQYSLFRDRDVCYSNIFQAPLGCHKDRISLSGIDMFVSRIFSRRHYAATEAEFFFQG